jgi:tetratricopeptide (TPR) repeat protein
MIVWERVVRIQTVYKIIYNQEHQPLSEGVDMKKIYFIMLFLLSSPFILSAQEEYLSELNKAKQFYDLGDFSISLKILLDLEKKQVKDKEVYYYTGRNYFDLSDYNNAEKYFKKALDLDPDYLDPYLGLSNIKINQNKPDQALEFVEKALTLYPDSGMAHLNYSIVLAQLHNSVKSKSEVYKAARLAPVLVMNYGMQFIMQQDKPEAALYYLQILEELYPTEPLILYNSGHIYKYLGEMDLAIQYYGSAYKYVDDSYNGFGVIWYTYFQNLFNAQQYEFILNTLFEKVDKHYPDAILLLALVCYKLEETEEFERVALQYFIVKGKTVPADLNSWAEEQCRDMATQ